MSDEKTVEKRVLKAVADQLNLPEEEVGLDSDFEDDLGGDSLDKTEIVMELEEEFELKIPDADAESIRTVRQAVTCIERLL